jgi:hypothetical protein
MNWDIKNFYFFDEARALKQLVGRASADYPLSLHKPLANHPLALDPHTALVKSLPPT